MDNSWHAVHNPAFTLTTVVGQFDSGRLAKGVVFDADMQSARIGIKCVLDKLGKCTNWLPASQLL